MDQACSIGGYPTKEEHDMPMMYTRDLTCNFTLIPSDYLVSTRIYKDE